MAMITYKLKVQIDNSYRYEIIFLEYDLDVFDFYKNICIILSPSEQGDF